MDDLLSGDQANELRDRFSNWRSLISTKQTGSISPLAEQLAGVKLNLPHGYHRFLPAWLLEAVLRSKLEGDVALSGESGDFRRLTQFLEITAHRQLFAVASGSESRALLEQLVSASASFEPSRFDRDGYLK